MPVLYKLVLWTLGCTAADGLEQCPAGDYYVHEAVFTAKKACEESLESLTWLALDEDNRSACILKDRLQGLETVEDLGV